MNRTPPSTVKKQLAEEVNYGCPVPSCGSPFLTWHHFDPPWRQEKHHRPEGMIALCAKHAAHADGGHWTKEQQRVMKREPYVKDAVNAYWPWTTEKIVFVFGSNILVGPRSVLHFNGKQIMEAKKSKIIAGGPDSVSLSVKLFDPSGGVVMKMEDNWMVFSVGALNSVTCPPQARKFEITHSSSVGFSLELRRLTLDEFLARWFSHEGPIQKSLINDVQQNAVDSDGLVPTLIVNCHLVYGSITVTAKDSGLSFAGSKLMGSYFSPGGKIVLPGPNGRDVLRFG